MKNDRKFHRLIRQRKRNFLITALWFNFFVYNSITSKCILIQRKGCKKAQENFRFKVICDYKFENGCEVNQALGIFMKVTVPIHVHILWIDIGKKALCGYHFVVAHNHFRNYV